RERCEMRGMIDRTEQEEPRRRRNCIYEDAPVRCLHEPAALGPQRVLRELERRVIQRGIAEAAVGLAVGGHEQCGPRLGDPVDRRDEHDTLAVAHALRERAAVARGLVALYPDL